jgi:hypothetical protein
MATATVSYRPRIHVLRESPTLDRYPLWFDIPDYIWRELYLDTWDRPCDEEGDPINAAEKDAEHVRKQYPFPVCLIY